MLRLSLLLSLAFPALAHAGEDYFVLMFGAQRVPAQPNYSHSFATFVRVRCPVGVAAPKTVLLDTVTISWLPADMEVRALALLPESGRNVDLHTTIRWC